MKNLTVAGLTSKAIRQELKTKFPNFKFKIRSQNFAGGNSIDIEWVDQFQEKKIHEITAKYQYGEFDGMIDLYEITNSRDDIPQVKYLFVKRNISIEKARQALNIINQDYGVDYKIEVSEYGNWYVLNDFYNPKIGGFMGSKINNFYNNIDIF